MSEEPILSVPQIERATALLKEVLALSEISTCLGVITGPNGVGKTIALVALEKRYSSLGVPGRAYFYRSCSPNGPCRGLRELLESMGLRGSLFNSGLTQQLLIRIAQKELVSRQIRALLVDEADTGNAEALNGLIALVDVCQQRGNPVALILAGAQDFTKWLLAAPSGLSRTLQVEAFVPMPPDLMMGVLQEWGAPFQKWAAQVKDKNKEAQRLLKLVHKATEGNFRRLRFFASVFLHHFGAEAEIDAESVRLCLSRMLTSTP